MNDASGNHAFGAVFGLQIQVDSRVLVASVRPDNERALVRLRGIVVSQTLRDDLIGRWKTLHCCRRTPERYRQREVDRFHVHSSPARQRPGPVYLSIAVTL